jgi:putative permease
VLIFLVIFLLPVLSRQVTGFLQELPRSINETQLLLLQLTEAYPQLVSAEQVAEITAVIRAAIAELGRNVLSMSLASIPTIVTLLVYLILGPLLVFFFLKDKAQITGFITSFLPEQRTLLVQVWREMDVQIGNYVRGKVYEIFIVGAVTYAVLAAFGLAYAPLLAVIVGLSVIIPYIGAAVATVPVAIAAYLQMGWSAEFAWIMAAYAIIQALDGNLLVPVLFSEAVNLHPVAIILAVLFFGGLWGFWGVFFAIPLATLVKALLSAWPREPDPEEPDTSLVPAD